jgi:hypothetical protein
MKIISLITLTIVILHETTSFKINMCDNKNIILKKNSNTFDRNVYAKYLINKRKSEKLLRTTLLAKFINETYNGIYNIHEYDNREYKIKAIKIGNNINIDVKNVKNIKISTNNDSINIELDKSEKNNKKIINEIDQLSRNIKELDTLLNLLDIFLTITN